MMRHVHINSSSSPILFQPFLIACVILVLFHPATVGFALAANGIADGETVWIDAAHIEGLIHTKQETIIRLLPRSLPAEFTRAEVDEFERRVRNLSLFDHVQVTRDGPVLTVAIEEKITLAPILNFTSGTSVKDLNATVGLVEYNLFGTGTQLGGQFNYSQRGPNVDLWLSQHAFEPGRWAKEIKGSYNVNGIRFADSASTWTRNRIGSEFELKGPYRYGSPLRYEVVMKFYRELVEDEKGTQRPPDGYYVGVIPELTWDKYHWHDLVPTGYRIALELWPGFFLVQINNAMKPSCAISKVSHWRQPRC